MYVDIGKDSREVLLVRQNSCERNPVGVVVGAHERFTLTIQSTRNFSDFRPWRFLD